MIMIYSNSNNIKGVEAKFAALNKLCKESKYENHRMCTENISDVFGKIAVSRSTNFVYATGPDKIERSKDDLIWYEGVLYAPASPSEFKQYFYAGAVILFIMMSIFVVLKIRWRVRVRNKSIIEAIK